MSRITHAFKMKYNNTKNQITSQRSSNLKRCNKNQNQI